MSGEGGASIFAHYVLIMCQEGEGGECHSVYQYSVPLPWAGIGVLIPLILPVQNIVKFHVQPQMERMLFCVLSSGQIYLYDLQASRDNFVRTPIENALPRAACHHILKQFISRYPCFQRWFWWWVHE